MLPPLRICLIGPHGAGKSTFARALGDYLRIPVRPELGRTLREAALAAGPERHGLAPDPDFDRAVLRGDLALDAQLPAQVILETWHPGNLAYAWHRCPAVARRHADRLRQHTRAQLGVVIQPVWAAPATLHARLSEPGGTVAERLAFFSAVAEDALTLATAWGLPVLPPVWTDAVSPGALAAAWPEKLWSRCPLPASASV
ncbi:MAG: AAA family ATPase [Myxococcales bacterium]|nr:AAA family ATPase [Myxococcales bacterium]MCB9524028.1 AAA family ATPase [Myxococcales bacterium]